MANHASLPTRRQFLKSSGAASIGLATSLAGCVGGDGGGGGNGGGDGGPKTTKKQNLTSIDVGYPPWANYLVLKHLQDTGLLSERLAEAGYEIGDLAITWNEITLFASGKTDFTTTLSDIEGAVIASQRDLDLTYHGIQAPNYGGWYVRDGSAVDPAKTGSVKATIQKFVKNQLPVGFAGWNQGLVWPNALILEEKFGVNHGSPEQSELKMRQADYFTLPKLLEQDEIDMDVHGAPILGTDTYVAMENSPIKPILWQQPVMRDLGVSPRHLNLGMYCTTQEFSDKHVEFVRAFMDAWVQGVEWVHNTDNWTDILSNQKNWKYLTANTKEEARINLEFSYKMKHSENTDPLAYKDIELTDKRIKGTKDAINRMVDLDLPVKENWEQHIEFKKLSLDSQ